MTCESLTDIILDMARGAAVPEAARFSVRRHMDTCPSCAAEYARQRELTTALQALAADAQEWRAPAAMEQRLLAAFATQNGKPAAADAPPTAGRWRYVLATAAMVTLVAWGITREAGEPANRGTGEPAGNGVAAGVSDGRATSVDPQPSSPPALSERGSQASRTTNPPSRSALPPSPSLRRTSRRDKPASRTASSVEFVRIPSAIGLPDLESGTVLRMELPLTALPEYGLQIAPDAMRTSIEADVLVGQDGQPRAIRLVGIPDAMAQDSRSRQ